MRLYVELIKDPVTSVGYMHALFGCTRRSWLRFAPKAGSRWPHVIPPGTLAVVMEIDGATAIGIPRELLP